MATDREAGFPITDFMGLDRQVDRENLNPRYFYNLQNLWEPKLGLLETRPGSEMIANSNPPQLQGLDNVWRIYKSETDKERIVAAQFPREDILLPYAQGDISVAWIADGSGSWLNTPVPDARTEPTYIIARLYGWGGNAYYVWDATLISGYTTGNTPSRLEVTINNPLDAKYTGVEILAVCRVGSTYAKVATANYNEYAMWVGNVETPQTPGTYTFYSGPASRSSAAAWPVALQTTARSFTYEFANTGNGELIGGKTYYMMVIPQHIVVDVAGNNRCSYRQPDISAGGVTAITVPEGMNTINITGISPSTFAYCIAIGEHPQLLVPYKVGHTAADSVYKVPKGYPQLVDRRPTSDTLDTYSFRHSDHSLEDMFVNFTDPDNPYPVFINRMHRDAQDPELQRCFFVSYNITPMNPFDPANTYDVTQYLKTYRYRDNLQIAGAGAKFEYTDWQKFAFAVCDYDPKRYEISSSPSNPVLWHRSGTAYFMTDGNVAGVAVMDYQSGTQVRVPSGNLIKKFQESILITGGDPVVDQQNGGLSDSSNIVYFTRPTNPFDFTVAGAGAPTLQFFTTEIAGEKNIGISLYTNTSGTEGPISQLVIAKRTSTWLLTNLPVASGGALPQTFMTNLSGKIGFYHGAMVNTPIGLIATSFENVYLIRESGEPTPIGDSIAPLIQGGEITNAVATYHDEHYKLSFYHPDFDGTDGYNNVEIWLDIEKMKALRGQPSWKGPMIGRSIDHVFVEDLVGETDERFPLGGRISIDGKELRIYQADIYPEAEDDKVYDFNTEVVALLETKDHEITQKDSMWNKLIKRHYWKLKTNRGKTYPLKFTEKTYIDGELVEDKTVEVYDQTGEFDPRALKVYPVFPVGRIRGRTIRKVFETKYRVGIGGYSLFYQVERRRI